MAKKAKDEDVNETDLADKVDEPFENQPSDLDELTHMELRLMHQEASSAILFAKNIQWRSVGASLLVFGACIAVAVATPIDMMFANLLSGITIVLTCGVIFVLLMYQFWQFNEISRIRKIEENFSTLYIKISGLKSRREGNAHRYTIFFFMSAVVIMGAVVANIAIKKLL